MNSIDTPILILIFNRPDKVRLLIERLSTLKPKYLYISADGPRTDKIGEKELCTEAQLIATTINWPCEVRTHFSVNNLGCKLAVSKGITWFFENVEAGIILEDDCIPNDSFFRFTSNLLEKYRDNELVMHINGTSFLPSAKYDLKKTFYFSHLAHSWGWATWKRAWLHYDPEMKNLESLLETLKLNKAFKKESHAKFWVKHLKHIRDRRVDSWANPWLYSVIQRNGLCITPVINLVSNIGFDKQATNTQNTPNFIETYSELPDLITFPSEIKPDYETDLKIMEKVFISSHTSKIKKKLRKWYDSLNLANL